MHQPFGRCIVYYMYTWTVLRLLVPGRREPLPVIGNLPGAQPGEWISARGQLRYHPDYGEQFHAESYRTERPATLAGIQRYLGSGLVKGIGPHFARRIVETFGEETLNVIDVGTINLMDTLTLAGTASDVFIINVSGDFTCNGCAISLSGGVTYTNVLFNVFNAGATLVDIFKPVAVVNGIFLAPLRPVSVDKATLNGAVIGAGVAMDTLTVHSGATVTFCPPCPACSP